MVNPSGSSYRMISDHGYAAVQLSLSNEQMGFFAKKSYRAGETLSSFSARAVLPAPSYLTVQLGQGQHILLFPEHLQYINHSCDPNVFFDTSALIIVALRDIAEGEEISFFYPSTEWEMDQPFTCHCGSSKCLGQIRGAAYIPSAQLGQYQLSQFIQQQLHDRKDREKRA